MPDQPRKYDPASTPLIPYAGASKRGRPIFRSDRYGAIVEVTPIEGGASAAGDGRALTGGDAEPRGTFEVRAEYDGPPEPAFDFKQGQTVRRTEVHNLRDAELATRVARAAEAMLGAGERNIFLPRIEQEVRDGAR